MGIGKGTLETMDLNYEFWNNKKVLITGHTGFKGTWLSLILSSLNSRLCGYALKPYTNPNFFDVISRNLVMQSVIGDIRDYEKLKKTIYEFNPEIIIHMAAQPLVRLSYDNPVETYGTNVLGLVNLLDIAKQSRSLRALLNVTSDKCYENYESLKSYNESDPLGGHDPYSNSKACAELVTTSFLKSFYKKLNIGLATARAGNIIGGGDWSQDRLIPDFIRAQQSNRKLIIRYPKAVRPWQHVIDPIIGYLKLCEKLYSDPHQYSEPWNFGPDDSSIVNVETLIKKMQDYSNKKVNVELDQNESKHEATLLKLDVNKAKNKLSWVARWDFENAIKNTLDWYECFYQSYDIYNFSLEQFRKYQSR